MSLGRKPDIPQWAQTASRKRLQESEGFNSYGEVKDWRERKLGVSASYKVVQDTVRYRLKAKLKRPRPQNLGDNPAKVEAFKETCLIDLELLKSYYNKQLSADNYKSVRYWCQDESRFELHTIPGRKITVH